MPYIRACPHNNAFLFVHPLLTSFCAPSRRKEIMRAAVGSRPINTRFTMVQLRIIRGLIVVAIVTRTQSWTVPSASQRTASSWKLPASNGGPKFIGDRAYDLVSKLAADVVNPKQFINQTQNNIPITTALRKLQINMDILDNVAAKAPQLTRIELVALASTILVSILAPIVCPIRVTELLVPSMAAVSASIGLSAEYIGKVEVAKGKEIAALAIQASAEAEALLAVAERAKAILPLCVGVATTASALALLAPSFVKSMSEFFGVEVLTETMLIFPVLSVLSAAIAGLATQECREVASRAAGLGARRFASSNQVGRIWLSATEQVQMTSQRSVQKWSTFAIGVLPAPLIAVLCPGALSYKAVVCAAIAAAQAAFYVAICEYFMAMSVESVALKSRAAAVADTYANQGSRAGSILPFTSALGGLCAAASAASVELLPLVGAVELQCALAASFPAGAALFAAAASVAKSRCEVDAAAASCAAARGLSPEGEAPKDPIFEVRSQVWLVLLNTWERVVTRVRRLRNAIFRKPTKPQRRLEQFIT